MGVDAGGDAFAAAEETYRPEGAFKDQPENATPVKPAMKTYHVDSEGNFIVTPANPSQEAEPYSMETMVVLKRAGEQAQRYEARITEQARLLGLQGKRIQKALVALGKDEWSGQGKDEYVRDVLMGKYDDE